jgi:signal transduction histidine kinase
VEYPPKILEKLNEFPLIKLLSEENFSLLVKGGKLITLNPGQLLFHEGSTQCSMYLILEGELKIYIGDTSIALRGPGEHIGEMSMIDPKVRSASAKSTSKTELFEIDKSTFDSFLATEPAILMELLKTVTSRAREDLVALKNKNIELQEFAQIASHDLQEPLRKVIVFGDFLKASAGGLNEKSREYIQRMQNSTVRMQKFIDDLLNYSKSGISQFDSELVNFKDLIHTVCDDLDHLIETNKGVVNISDLPELKGVKSRLYQLFFNLIINSIKFKKEDESLIINIYSRKKENNYWEICIEDNGIGFDEKYTDRIFQPFQQLHGKSEYEGSGLGLSICKKIVQQHNGILSVSSKPGEGSTFIIILPEYS